MEIVKTVSSDSITLAITGKLSAATADECGVAVDLVLGETKNLILDLKELSYLASAGLRVLVSAQKKLNAAGGALSLLNVCEEVMEVFEITGLDDVFDIH
ncbi:MAG: STAS domain-containing protein [Treponema sp.]|jgi:anti-sigma B factor antagonist|nr:STAS domain-containing protein [Treponema sp.]